MDSRNGSERAVLSARRLLTEHARPRRPWDVPRFGIRCAFFCILARFAVGVERVSHHAQPRLMILRDADFVAERFPLLPGRTHQYQYTHPVRGYLEAGTHDFARARGASAPRPAARVCSLRLPRRPRAQEYGHVATAHDSHLNPLTAVLGAVSDRVHRQPHHHPQHSMQHGRMASHGHSTRPLRPPPRPPPHDPRSTAPAAAPPACRPSPRSPHPPRRPPPTSSR